MLNHKKKRVFIHIPKTAGTSISDALGVEKDHTHSSIQEVIDGHVREKVFKVFRPWIRAKILNYFKFAFVRNPWDRMVSLYFEKKQTGWIHNINFDEFVTNLYTNTNFISNDPNLTRHARSCFDHLSIDGSLAMDFVGRFEKLENDYQVLCSKLKLTPKKLKVVRKRKHEHYSNYYNSETKELVAHYHKNDIKHFGYQFDLHQ